MRTLFRLVRTPQGLILTTEMRLTNDQAQAIRETWDQWVEANDGSPLIIPECEYVEVDTDAKLVIAA
jgi:hypothetical protein